MWTDWRYNPANKGFIGRKPLRLVCSASIGGLLFEPVMECKLVLGWPLQLSDAMSSIEPVWNFVGVAPLAIAVEIFGEVDVNYNQF